MQFEYSNDLTGFEEVTIIGSGVEEVTKYHLNKYYITVGVLYNIRKQVGSRQ